MSLYSFIRTLLLVCGIFSLSVQAADMNFKGALIDPPPCSINNGALIDVDFGDRVGINKVNGVNYRQQVNYQIICAPGVKGWDLTLTLKGVATAFDKSAVQTDQPDLGIRILQNKESFPLESTIIVDPKSPPVLEAVPVVKLGGSLQEGIFEAAATLQANYQ